MTPAFWATWSSDSAQVIDCIPPEERACIAWSHSNVIAFASSESPSSATELGSHQLHIFYPDRPWEKTSFDADGAIYNLSWNYTGNQLLSADKTGKCKIWQAKENFINIWECVQTVCECARFISLTWLQGGPQTAFRLIGDEPQAWSKVFPRVKTRSVLKGIWGKSTDGFVGLTSSGKLCVGLLTSERIISSQRLPYWGEKEISAGDLLVTPDGVIAIGVADSDCVISIYHLTLDMLSKDNCGMKIEKFSQFNVTDTSSIHLPSKINKLSLSWQSTLTVIINVSGDMTDNNIEVWERNPTSSDFSWIKHASYRIVEGSVTHLTMSGIPSMADDQTPGGGGGGGGTDPFGGRRSGLSLPLSQSGGGGMRGALIIGLNTGKLLCLDRKNLTQIAAPVHISQKNQSAPSLELEGHHLIPASKRARVVDSHFASALSSSPCSCCVAALTDAGEIVVFRLSPRALGLKQEGFSPSHMARHFSSLFLYGLVAKKDWWDVLVSFCATPKMEGLFEAIWKQLENSFCAQPPALQELYSLRYLSILYTLGRCSPDGCEPALLLHSQLTLNALGAYFKSLLSGSSDMSGSWPEEQLQALKRDSRDDLEVVRDAVDLQDFLPNPDTLISCRHLVQWTVDTASSVIQKNGLALSKAPFYIRTASLALLRELLVLIKIWIEVQPRCSPTFTRVPASMDCLSVLFKQVTKLWNQRESEGGQHDPSAGDIDSTIPLVPAPPNSFINLSTLSKGFTLGRYGNMSHHVDYEFDCSPGYFRHPMALKAHDPFLASGLRTPKGLEPPKDAVTVTRDIIFLLYIPSDEQGPMRKCSRCSGVSVPFKASSQATDVSLSEVWGSHWSKWCICGGQWIQTNSTSSRKG
eukprot:m.52451 g.52451  ORF g.52451 m.52451 type:complete len:865 (+) comp34208_c0_seq3:62-2656(+)